MICALVAVIDGQLISIQTFLKIRSVSMNLHIYSFKKNILITLYVCDYKKLIR